MKLIIQIPCYNEEETLPLSIQELPRQIEGIDIIEYLIIDDGSVDRTVEVARENGVHHIVKHIGNKGLAKGFMTGINACLDLGADIIVNTDADNQYNAKDIDKLVQPIIEKEADFVIGARPISTTEHFSFIKKALQKLGSYVIRRVSKTEIADAPSGFRALSRNAAQQINVFSEYTYTLETIIQAGHKGLAIKSVPIRTNADLRPSRLVSSIPKYVKRSMTTIFRIFMTYQPLGFFAIPGVLLFLAGTGFGLRFLYFHFFTENAGHVQSVILSALLIGLAFALIVVGLIADLISVNRKLLEKIDWKLSKLEDEIKKKEV